MDTRGVDITRPGDDQQCCRGNEEGRIPLSQGPGVWSQYPVRRRMARIGFWYVDIAGKSEEEVLACWKEVKGERVLRGRGYYRGRVWALVLVGEGRLLLRFAGGEPWSESLRRFFGIASGSCCCCCCGSGRGSSQQRMTSLARAYTGMGERAGVLQRSGWKSCSSWR